MSVIRCDMNETILEKLEQARKLFSSSNPTVARPQPSNPAPSWAPGRRPGSGQQSATPSAQSKATMSGPGTELKLLLKRFGIVAQPNCKCGQRAREMDSNGIEWCEEHIEEIVDWLEEEAHGRHLPFVRLAAVVLIRRAIRNAKRKEKAK